MSKKKELYSYLVPRPENFKVAWSYSTNEPSLSLVLNSPVNIDWTKGTDVQCAIEININKIEEYFIFLQREQNLVFSLVVSWYSPFALGGTSLRGIIGTCDCLITGNPETFSIHGTVPGNLVSGELHLTAQLVVKIPGIHTGYSVGVDIWSENVELILEGARTLFPTKIISFSSDPKLPNGSLYYLLREVEYLDFNEPFNNVYTLLLNEDNELTAILNSTSKNPILPVQGLLQFVQMSVYREIMSDIATYKDEMVESLNNPEKYDIGSIGFAYHSIFNQILVDYTMFQKIDFLKSFQENQTKLDLLLQQAVFLQELV
ncbi:MAG: hypothetical protein RBR15_00820 [Sphaerochaeta sp.]|nr:hypothetical protein [Sphaerochaeta sp.]